MVVAQQMQHRVHHQIRQLPAVGVPVLLGLCLYPLHGQHHVAQRHQPRAGVGVLRAGQLSGRQLELRKAQHVGGPVHLPHVQIDLMDARVTGHQHVHLAGEVHPLHGQRCADDPADQRLLLVAHSRHVGGDGDVMPLRHYFFLLSSYRA